MGKYTMHPEYRPLWVQAGYKSTMGSAKVTKPPPKDKIRAYHFTSAQYAISAISLARLKVARFADLNDPFELLGAYFRETDVRKAVKDFKNVYDQHTGLLCFSADWTSPVLWSHYAERHRGICLGFNLRRDRAERVKYEDKRLKVELAKAKDKLERISPEAAALLRITKFSPWEYEQEIRHFVDLKSVQSEGSLHFHHFGNFLELAEVILGPQCTVPLEDVRSLVGRLYQRDDIDDQPAVTFKARLAYNSFSVVPYESTVP